MVGVGRHQLLDRSRGPGPERQAGVRGRQSGTPNLDPSSVTEQTVDWKVGAVWTGQAWRRERSWQP